MQRKVRLNALFSFQNLLFISSILLVSCGGQKIGISQQGGKKIMHLADPTILEVDGHYYSYGTAGDQLAQGGFPVYTSRNLRNWKLIPGHKQALIEGESYGNKGFWAPQILPWGSRYLMAYTANEQIAIAYSDQPSGPFKQTPPFHALFNDSFKHIDPFIFQDSGQTYLYYVKLDQGNKIFVSQVKTNITNHLAKTRTSSQTPENTVFEVLPGTERLCIEADGSWENTINTDWPVTEGPTVIKHKGVYYLFYSANDYRNPDYAVGYATATSPMGPWKKSTQNPIISRENTGIAGTGHGDVFQDNKGHFYYVFHAHNSDSVVSPRRTLTVPFSFVSSNTRKKSGGQGEMSQTATPDKIIVDSKAVRTLDYQ